MAKAPAPLTPAGCSMGGNEWFPLHHRRLRKSKWWRRASDLARARNIMLWGEAYDAVPAGSLADDDDELAEAAGFGMDVTGFIAVKAEIMAPWTLCSDGRWYHPTLCEVVLEVWEEQSAARRQARERQARRRATVRAKATENTQEKTPVTRDVAAVTEPCHAVTPVFPRGEERREDEINPPTPQGVEQAFEEAFAAYPLSGRASTDRAKALAAWGDACERHGPAAMLAAVRAYATSDYATAERGKRVPSFQRWLSGGRFEVWLPQPDQPGRPAFTGPSDVLAAVEGAFSDPARGRAFLAQCTWRDLPDRAVVSDNTFVASTLRREAGAALTALGVAIRHEVAA